MGNWKAVVSLLGTGAIEGRRIQQRCSVGRGQEAMGPGCSAPCWDQRLSCLGLGPTAPCVAWDWRPTGDWED